MITMMITMMIMMMTMTMTATTTSMTVIMKEAGGNVTVSDGHFLSLDNFSSSQRSYLPLDNVLASAIAYSSTFLMHDSLYTQWIKQNRTKQTLNFIETTTQHADRE